MFLLGTSGGSIVQISEGVLCTEGALCTFDCNVAFLQESKLEAVSRPIAISLWGCHPIERLYFPSVGHSRGIIVIFVIWDPQVLELGNSHIDSFSICYKFKSLEDNFEWGLIGVYGPNDYHM